MCRVHPFHYHKYGRAGCIPVSVADPGCLSQIRLFSIPDPNCLHPRSSSKNLSILTQKKWFLSSKKYDPGCSSRIRMLTFSQPGSRGQKGTQYRIRNTGSCPPSAVRTCRVYPFHHLKCGCAGCLFLLKPDCPASGQSGTLLNRMFQSGTGITGTSSIPECSVTVLRYRMPECRCQAMVGRCPFIPEKLRGH
jgi:hypothetical protein